MIVITGATGTVGRLLIEVLTETGADVRAVSRAPEVAGLPAGVEVVPGDPAQPATMAAALHGATSLFLHPRAAGSDPHLLVSIAREQGVRRVVALAAANVDDDPDLQPSRARGDRNREADHAAATSGLEWTSLRPSSFASNAATAWAPQIRAGDTVAYVYPGFEESPIHERDLAAVAARALLTDELLGRRPVLTGPDSLSHERMVAIIGEVIGRPLRFAEVSAVVAARGMVGRGLPEPFVTALMDRYAAYLDRPQHPATDEAERILRRPARSFADWAADNATAFTARADA